MKDSFKTRQTLSVGGQTHQIYSLPSASSASSFALEVRQAILKLE